MSRKFFNVSAKACLDAHTHTCTHKHTHTNQMNFRGCSCRSWCFCNLPLHSPLWVFFFLPLSGKERGHTQNKMSVQRSTYNTSDNTFESASDKLLCNVRISVTTLCDKIGSVTNSAWLLLMSELGFENQT